MSALLGALAGFISAVVTLGVPLGKMAWDTRRDARRAVMHLTGEGAYGHEGVIPRIAAVEDALDREGIDVPDPEPEEG
jgi:hypothetical protein